MNGVGYQGLDYAGVMAVINSTVKRKKRSKIFKQIQLIETGALGAING
jgi:hypothetical protein